MFNIILSGILKIQFSILLLLVFVFFIDFFIQKPIEYWNSNNISDYLNLGKHIHNQVFYFLVSTHFISFFCLPVIARISKTMYQGSDVNVPKPEWNTLNNSSLNVMFAVGFL